jgi:hypothetical protein
LVHHDPCIVQRNIQSLALWHWLVWWRFARHTYQSLRMAGIPGQATHSISLHNTNYT